MKTKLIITAMLLTAATSVLNAQKTGYIHLLDTNKVWTEAMLLEFGDFHIFNAWTGDTLSNNDTLYYEFFSEHLGTATRYLREDTIEKKVWYRQSFDYNEQLYYDFSMEIGDSISFYDTPGLYFKVEQKQTESVLGIDRYVYYLRGTWDVNNSKVIWIEGIGSLAGILKPHNIPIFIWAGSTELNCYYYNNMLQYQSDMASEYGCHFETLGMYEPANNTIKIYPNPASDIFTIDLSVCDETENLTLRLYDIYGKCVKQKKIHSNKVQTDISILPSGLYLIRISLDNKILYSKKLINH